MRNRIVTAVKQRFSIRKLSIGAASVLLGTSLYFMGASSPVVHAATTSSESAASSTDINKPVGVAENSTMNDADPVDVAGYSTMNDADVNNAIDKYAQGKQKELQKELGDHAPLIRASDKQPVTVDTLGKRACQVGKIKDKIDTDIEQAKEQAKEDNESIEKYEKDHPRTVNPNDKDSDFFKNQGLSIDDERDSKINQISVDHKDISLKDITLPKDKDQSEKFDGIDGIDVTYTNKMTHKEQHVMKINSDNKVIVDFQHNQCSGKEITVTYDNLNNSYYLENINNKTNRIKISKIERTFSDIHPTDNTIFTSNGSTPTSDGLYDECHGPQLIIYNDPSDGFFYNNIEQVSVKDIYYDDKGDEITFKDKDGDKNKAWIFVTSLNSDGLKDGKTCRKDGKTYIEKVKAEIKAENSDPTPADIEKLAGSTVTGPVEGNAADTHHGWWYSDEDNGSYNNGPYTGLAWDNNSEDNRYAFVGAVAIKYQPGLTITYGADDNAWGSHWVCTQTQVVSSLNQRVIIYDHIKDGTENVTGNDDVNMTVHYVMDDGSNAPSDSKQTVNFTETGVKDKVTGKIAWTPADSQTLNDVPSPVLTGYTADIKTAKGKAVNFGDPDINVTVHYSANAQTAKITYIDDTTKNNLDSQAAIGKFGQAITFATAPAAEIENYKKKGYVFVSNNFDNQTYQAVDSNNVFEVHFKHGTITVTPDNPGDPKNPINPNDPDPKSPKYPEGTTKNDLTKDSTQTIIYHYSDGSKPDEKKTETHEDTFTRTKVVDKVTGEVITTTPWTGSHTFDSKDVPVVNGYHSDKKTVGGKTATVNNPDVTDTVTYTPNGKIIPVDPSGNPIPNVPNPTYPTDPNDPTKVVPNEPVPDVPGRTPEVSTVTPEDPSQDTPVVYNPIPNVPGPSVGPSDNTPTPVTPTPGKTTEEKKPDENKDDKDVDEPDDDEDVVPTPRHHKKHNGGESRTTRPRPTGYTPAPRGSSYLDANGKVHYKLPQTGESDSEEMAAVLGGAAATIGLIGLAGAKKRRHE